MNRPASTAPLAVEEKIERLYDELMAMAGEETAAGPSKRSEEIDRVYVRLLGLQASEARQFRERFEASLKMPIDAGAQILARARALREELEELRTSDPFTDDPDCP